MNLKPRFLDIFFIQKSCGIWKLILFICFSKSMDIEFLQGNMKRSSRLFRYWTVFIAKLKYHFMVYGFTSEKLTFDKDWVKEKVLLNTIGFPSSLSLSLYIYIYIYIYISHNRIHTHRETWQNSFLCKHTQIYITHLHTHTHTHTHIYI